MPFDCLKNIERKGECIIDNDVKNQKKANQQTMKIASRRTTKIVVKEHFSKQGKTMEELLTDVMLEKAKQTIA
ncbi:MAG: tRNA wybutosine-synthesizing protein 3-like protein [Marvinbryantia sp.]|uniref:tRNA wybutosine-synthesizing protein 3-like protein n=1 Tax=Marvinbryantia sp. TaxID=2496532 RepID=UPI00399C3861